MNPQGYEAVQFGDLRPWHAVNPGTDRTPCGRRTEAAQSMWRSWDEQGDRCKRCESSAAASRDCAARGYHLIATSGRCATCGVQVEEPEWEPVDRALRKDRAMREAAALEMLRRPAGR